jgi:DNA-binding XRE family transcriptional regulator
MATPKRKHRVTRRSAAEAPALASENSSSFSRWLSADFVADVSLLDSAVIDLAEVAAALGISKSQLADTVGMSRETFHKRARSGAPKTQTRLREMLEILNRVSAWAGGRQQAMAWYRAQPLPAFGGRTAESLVKSGQATMLRDYLDHIALGGYA